jgi:PilZ domain
VLDATPAAIRDEAAAAAGAERRAHVRLAAAELEWLRQVRLKNGPPVKLVDLSRGGALIDSRVQMRPGSTMTLEISGQASLIELASEVLRCQLAQIGGGPAIYRGACMFTEPLEIEEIRRRASRPAVQPPAPALTEAAGLAPTAWQKIVVRYRDGGMLKGYTLDFHSSREHFSLWPSVNASRSERVIVPLARLKALFFVKDFAGNPERGAGAGPLEDSASGRRIEVTFLDGEVIRGTTLSYRPDGIGFFLTPSDSAGNNQRVFVVTGAVRHARFP